MRKLKVLLVEDQDKYIMSLKRYLAPYDTIIDIGSIVIAKTITQAKIAIINSEGFDVTIMDYMLPDTHTNCFVLLAETTHVLHKYGTIVFTTIDAVENENFKKFKPLTKQLVLEKPFGEDEMADLILELKDRHLKTDYGTEESTVALNMGLEGEKLIPNVNDILYIEGAGKFCNYFILDNNTIKQVKNVSGTLGDQLARLTTNFIQVHKSYIVNILKIKQAKKDGRYSGWISFTDSEYNPTINPFVARYSIHHENYELLKQRTGLSKI